MLKLIKLLIKSKELDIQIKEIEIQERLLQLKINKERRL